MAIVNQNFRNALANISKNSFGASAGRINVIPGSLTHTTMGVFGKETINNIPTSVAS